MSDLQKRRDELQRQYYEIGRSLEEVERELIVESHDVLEALRGTRWIFHGDTCREDIAAYKALPCYQFRWSGSEESLPEQIKLGLRVAGASSTINLGAFGKYPRVQLNEHDGDVTLRFSNHTRDGQYVGGGQPLLVAKELGLQLDFSISLKDAREELKNAQEKLALVEDVITLAEILLGDDNVLGKGDS